MGQRRQTKHAIASAATSRAPSNSKRSRKEKPHAPVAAARPARPRKLTPPPPVTDCAKCSKLAEAKAIAARWQALATKLQGEIDARNKAALAGVSVTLDAAAIAKVIEEVYHPCFGEVLAVSRDIALNPAAEDKDRLKAVGMIKDQVAGKVTEKHELSAKDGAPIYLIPGLPQPAPVPAAVDASPDPEQSEGSGA